MDIGSILLVLALAVLVAVFVAGPFRRSGKVSQPPSPKNDRRSALQAKRERSLEALRELDGDYAMGKVPESEYPIQRSALLASGAQALEGLDRLGPDSVEPRLTPNTADLESLLIERRQARSHPQLRCHNCGSLLKSTDRFCAQCGKPSGDEPAKAQKNE